MSDRAAMLLRGMLFALGTLVAGQAMLGFTGFLGGRASLAWLLIVFVASLTIAVRKGAFSLRAPMLPGWKNHEAAWLLAQFATLGILLHEAAGRRQFLYDTISFHFYFPAAWMQSGRLEIIPTVFGDVAPAYNPSNVELLFHLVMAPLASDYFARCMQIPIAVLAMLAIYVGSRELGASRSAALSAGLAFLVVPMVRWNAISGLVDLAMACFFLASMALLVRLWRRPSATDFAALAVAYGLFIGSKFVALPYSLPIVLALSAVCWRHRESLPRARALGAVMLAGLGLVISTGGFWYLRNALVTGNPLYPLAVEVAGFQILSGLQDGSSMRQWVYHRPVGEWRQLLQIVFGGARAFMLAGVVALVVRRRGPETWLAAVLLAVFWFVVPYQHPRFLIAFYGLIAVSLAMITGSGTRSWPGYMLILASMMGSTLQWAIPELGLIVAFGLAGSLLPLLESRLSAKPFAVLGLVLVCSSLIPGFAAYEDSYPGYSVPDQAHLFESWRWLRDHVQDEHIAYAGSNLPYPLFGRGLSNQVSYVPVSGDAKSKIHDYESQQPTRSAEPTQYRELADVDIWLRNLRSLGCETLFVSSLTPRQRQFFLTDGEGFPLERTWADERPDRFALRYSNPGVRIYAIEPESGSDG